eukprot:evm.model.scf_304.1 EVM.evm.TU.scf_304.1   scf_304:73750-75938(-)
MQAFDLEKKDREADQDLEPNRWKLRPLEHVGFTAVNDTYQVRLDRMWDLPRMWEILALDSADENFLPRLSLSWKIAEGLTLLVSQRLSRASLLAPSGHLASGGDSDACSIAEGELQLE